MEHRIEALRGPVHTDTPCLVCLGLIAASSTATVRLFHGPPTRPADVGRIPLHDLDGRVPVPTVLIVAHEPCMEATTTAAIRALRANPRGPEVDNEGATVLMHKGVRYRVFGSHRTAVMAAIRDAIQLFESGTPTQPIVAFVRAQVQNRPDLQPFIGAVVENPGPPPDQRGPDTPAHVVTFATRIVHPATPEDTARTAHTSAAPPFAPAGYTSAPPPTGNYNPLPHNPLPDPTATAGRTGRNPLSPSVGDNHAASTPARGTPGGPASLPPPGEVTSAMLDPLDTEETIKSRPKVADALKLGLGNAFPRLRIKSVSIDRDPLTLAERVLVVIDRRIVTEPAESIARDMAATLRARVPSWATMEAAGVTLVVQDDPASVASGGDSELSDEVNLRALPQWPKAHNAPTMKGTRVAVRGPLWNALLGTSAAEETDAVLGPYGPEVRRIRAKLLQLIDADPSSEVVQDARIGIMEGYDAVTGHACVQVEGIGKKTFYLHCHPSWLIVWNVPPGVGKAPAAPSPGYNPPPMFPEGVKALRGKKF